MWRPELPHETLKIELQPRNAASDQSTIGFIKAELNSGPGRHLMHLVKDKTESFNWHKFDIAHEMGHVLGLVHEHQHSDRDDYVHFDCTKILGYEQFKETYDANPHMYPPEEEICASNWMAEEMFDWPGPAEFSTDMGSHYDLPIY